MSETKGKSTIDFSKSSQKDLIAALGRIHKDKFPANYQACIDEIQKRKDNGTWSEEVEKLEQSPPRSLFSLKRRFFSYFIDGAVVTVFSLLFIPLSDSLNSLGQFGVLPFWFITFLYGTLLDGPVGKGQTFGKKVTSLRIANSSGGVLSWKQAGIRGLYLILLVGSRYGLYGYFPGTIAQYFDFILFFFYVGDFLCMIKHPQQRSLVDLLTDTLVLDSESSFPEKVEGASALLKYKKWFAGAAVILAGLFIFSFVITNQFVPSAKYDGVKSEVESNTSAHYLSAGIYTSYMNGQQTAHGTNLSFWLPSDVLSNESSLKIEAEKIRKIISNPSYEMAGGQNNILLTGNVFKGLLPIHYVYRNPDMNQAVAK